eukprot:scaffold7756_cov17-Tisochrysis_lutea.AAC.2
MPVSPGQPLELLLEAQWNSRTCSFCHIQAPLQPIILLNSAHSRRQPSPPSAPAHPRTTLPAQHTRNRTWASNAGFAYTMRPKYGSTSSSSAPPLSPPPLAAKAPDRLRSNLASAACAAAAPAPAPSPACQASPFTLAIKLPHPNRLPLEEVLAPAAVHAPPPLLPPRMMSQLLREPLDA